MSWDLGSIWWMWLVRMDGCVHLNPLKCVFALQINPTIFFFFFCWQIKSNFPVHKLPLWIFIWLIFSPAHSLCRRRRWKQLLSRTLGFVEPLLPPAPGTFSSAQFNLDLSYIVLLQSADTLYTPPPSHIAMLKWVYFSFVPLFSLCHRMAAVIRYWM